MKKILYVSVIAILFFAMFSCTQAPETTPNDIEAVTPEEIPNEAETITPNEIETVTPEPEVVTPTEPKTPTAPETPAEPEVPAEPEAVEPKLPFISETEINFDGEVFTLPAEDEDTKTIVIEFPEIALGYTEPELVSPEDFEWGEYSPFVMYMIDSYGELGRTPFYSYAFLGSGINSLEEGNAAYEKLHEKYKRSVEFSEELATHFPLWKQSIIPLSLESKLIYVSEDCSKIGVRYIEKDEASGVFHLKYDLYENGVLSSAYTLPNDDNGFFTGFANVYYFEGECVTAEKMMYKCGDKYVTYCHNNGSLEIYTEEYDHKDLITVYSTKENKLKYKIAMNFTQDFVGTHQEIHQVLNERYLLISFYDYFKDHGPCNNLYLLDMETSEMTRIMGYSFYPMLSPDGKYLIYSNYYEFGQGVNSPCNENYEMGYGFYVKNLETSETTFFENPDENDWMTCNQTLMWVNTEALESAIEK